MGFLVDTLVFFLKWKNNHKTEVVWGSIAYSKEEKKTSQEI